MNVIFNYKGRKIEIQCTIDEKMEVILNKFKIKMNEYNANYFIYNGNYINKEKQLGEIINNEDKKLNQMNIIVYDLDEIKIKDLKGIICPECNENVIININDYKLEMKCINNHINTILLKDYINIIDISKIKCIKCNKNKNYTNNNEFFICLKCNINLCSLCQSFHDKNHIIINYDDKNYICNKHNENYNKYCCNKNICKECDNEHINHKGIYYKDILPDLNDDIKLYIKKLKDEINNIKKNLNNIMYNIIDNIDIYYKIYNNIINNYKNNKKNYEIIQNINEFINFNKIIKKDIEKIINDKDINIQFKRIMNIYYKINNFKKGEFEIKERDGEIAIMNSNEYNNYIIGEFEVKENNKRIKIINSYEQFLRETKEQMRNEYKNEEEIKENIEIIINGKKIPFTYFYKFKEKGKYKIKYIFKKKLTNICCMFYGCSFLINIDLSNFKSQNINFMGGVFMKCSSLNNINLNNFNTQNALEMWSMFRECSSLKNLDLSNFNIQNVNNMGCMFDGCSNLKFLNLSNFNTQNITKMGCIFNGCSFLRKNNVISNDYKILNLLR